MFKNLVSGFKSVCNKVVDCASKVKALVVGAGATAAAVAIPEIARAEGEFTLTMPPIDMTLLGTLATAILGGLAAMWLLRKVIKTINKS